MSPSNNNRNSGRQPETPQRVANAAEQMRNTAAHGNFRGYVPQQTGSQQPMGRNPSMQPGNRAAGYMNPMYRQQTQQPVYHAVPQAADGQRGFGMPAMQQKPKKKHRVWLYLLIAVLVIGMIAGGLQVFATCAGLILLAEKIEDVGSCTGVRPSQWFGALPVTVRRNAYGRQLGSFRTVGTFDGKPDVPMTFIRAPAITEVSPEVEVLSTFGGAPTSVRWRCITAFTWHPELG